MVSLRSISAFVALSLGVASAGPAIIGKDQAFDFAVNATSRLPAQQTITVSGAKFITVHFSQFTLAEGDVVSLSDASGKVVVEYSGLGRGDLGDKGGFYSTQVASSSVTVQYKPSPVVPTSGEFGFTIDKVVRIKSSGSVSSVCSANQSEPPKCYASEQRAPQAFAKAQAVARLTVAGGKYCTGWLVGSEGHLLTNYHCIASQFEATNTEYEFSAESPECDGQCGGAGGCRGTIAATTAKFIAGDKTLDYALVKLNPTVDLSQYGYLKLRVSGGVDQEQIYIPQHPGGKAKVLAVVTDSGDVTRATIGVSNICGKYRVGYDADTEEGSSGSPVIGAKDNAVIGLHSCGVDDKATVCVNSATDVRALVDDFKKKNIVPADALDDPNAQLPADGPWLPATPAPGPVTPAPTVDFCRGFSSSKSTCEVFTQGKCTWAGPATCVKTDTAVAAAPAPTPAPTTLAPATEAPVTPPPTTPAPTTPAPTTSAPLTPVPTTVAAVSPVVTTAAPARDICPGFVSKTSCEVFTLGKCQWVNDACIKK